MYRFVRYLLIGLIVSILLVCLAFGVGVYLLYHKQEKWVQLALSNYNAQIEGKISLNSSRVSPFANFPYISIDLHGLRAYTHKKDSLPLLAIGDVYVGFDLIKIIQGDLQIAKVKLVDGHMDLLISNDSTFKPFQGLLIPSEHEREKHSESISKELKKLDVRNFKIKKSNTFDSSHYELHFQGLAAGFRKSPQEVFIDLNTNFLLSLTVNQSVLAKQKPIAIQTALDYTKEEQRLTFSTSDLYLDGVLFTFSGAVDMANDLDLDVQVRGEKQDFSLLFALLPEDFAAFAARYQNAGNIYFEAGINGKSSKGHIPRIEAHFGCQHGFFHNTVVDRKVDQLSFSGYFTNGEDGTLSSSEFRLLDFNAVPEQGFVKVSLVIRDLLDPYVDLQVYTDFDLQFLADFFELRTLQGLQGQVLLDVNYNELVALDQPEAALMSVKQGVDSRLEVRNLQFQIPGYPIPVDQINMLAVMEDGRLDLDTLSIRMGQNQLHFSGFVSNLPAMLHKQAQPVELGVHMQSDFIDLYALSNFDSLRRHPIKEEIHGLSTSFRFVGLAQDLVKFDYLPKGEFMLDDFSLSLKNYPHTFHDFDIHLSVNENDLELHKWRGLIDASDFLLSATAFNYPKWMRDTTDGNSQIRFSLSSSLLRPADILGPKGVAYLPEAYLNEEIRQFRLLGSMDLNYAAGAMQAYSIQLDDAKALFTVHPFRLQHLQGLLNGQKGSLQAEKVVLRLGKSDADIDFKFHFADELKHLPNHFNLRATLLDMDDLSNYAQIKSKASDDSVDSHAEAFNIFQLPFSNTDLNLNISALKYQEKQIDNLRARLRMTKEHMIHVDELSMRMLESDLSLSGYFNGQDPSNIYFYPDLSVSNLDLNKLLFKVDNMGKEMVINEHIKGVLSGRITGTVRMHPDLFPILDASTLDIDLTIKDGVMVNYPPLQMLGRFFADRNLNYVRFDTLQNTFTLRDNALFIPAMTINSSLGFIEISGRQSLDLDMDYQLRIPWRLVTNAGTQKLFGRRNRDEVPEDQIDEIVMRDTGRRVRFLNLRLRGTPDDFNVSLGRDRNSGQVQ